jgi:hypothetical protein
METQLHLLKDINKKLEYLNVIKRDLSDLKRKMSTLEEVLIEELTEEEKKELEEAIEEHKKGRTISLKEAKKALGV